MGDFSDIKKHSGLMIEDEKAERENWRVGKKNLHSYTVFTSLQAAKGPKIVRIDNYSLSKMYASVADIYMYMNTQEMHSL